MKSTLILFLVLFCLVIQTGCSQNQALSGIVTFADDGSPVPCGTIYFDDGQRVGRGDILSDGRYTIGFEKMGNGIPKGTYKVYFSGVASVEKKTPTGNVSSRAFGDDKIVTPLIDNKYNQVATTDIVFQVDGKTSQFDIKLDRAKNGKVLSR